MPAVALMGGESNVDCTDGAIGAPCGQDVYHWNAPTTQVTNEGSSNVFVNGIGVVRNGDAMASHPDGNPCTASAINHAPTLSSYSSNVFANGKNIGRVGDRFNSDGHYSHIISSGSINVFIGIGGATNLIYIDINGFILTTEDNDFIIGE